MQNNYACHADKLSHSHRCLLEKELPLMSFPTTTAAMPVVASRAHVFYPPTTRSTMKQDCFSLWKIAYFCIPGQLSIADSMDTVKISKRFA